MHENRQNWKQICQSFDSWKWREVVDEKHAQIEDADDLWNEIKAEIGEQSAEIVIPLLNMASDTTQMDAKLQEALKKYS